MTPPDRRLERNAGWLVAGCLAILVFLATLGGAIAGSYALTLSAIHTSEVRAMANQLQSAKGECRALVALDHSGRGIVFPHVDSEHPAEEALQRLFAGIHGVVEQSHCTDILNGTFRPPAGG